MYLFVCLYNMRISKQCLYLKSCILRISHLSSRISHQPTNQPSPYQPTSFLNFSIFQIQTGEETFFKIKKTTKMSKVFSTYAQRKGVQVTSLRFLLDGERIEENATPKTLELEDNDQIDCMLEQVGGEGHGYGHGHGQKQGC